jgi:hypothetical protein
MRKFLYENDGSAARWTAITASALTLLGLACVIGAFAKTNAGLTTAAPSASGSVSPHWMLNSHSQCREGNLDATVAARPRQI